MDARLVKLYELLGNWLEELRRLDRISSNYPTDLTTGQIVMLDAHIRQLEEILNAPTNYTQ